MNYKALKKWLIWERKQKKMGCPLPTATKMAEVEEIETVPSLLLPCASCNRTFRPEALTKHIKVCEKTLMKKRKQFDSSKQRIKGTDLAQFLPTQKAHIKAPSPKIESQSRWKEKSNQSVKSVKNNKKEVNKPSDHEQCLYCDRYFGPKAYDRHTEWCKEQQHRVRVKNNDIVKAKERLQARTKYQAPSFKSQRMLTKEKYSPSSKQIIEMTSPFKEESSFKFDADSNNSSTTVRQNSMRGNFKNRSPGNSLTRNRTSSLSSQASDKKSQSSTYSDMDRNEENMRQSRPRVKQTSTVQANNRDVEKYDPFVSAELQMLELLKTSDKDSAKVQSVHVIREQSPPSLFQSSPSSAFSPPVNSTATPPLSKPSDMPSNPLSETNTPSKGSEDKKTGVSKVFSLSTLSLCSTISIDSLDYNMNSKRSIRRANSAAGFRGKSKYNMNDLLYGTLPDHKKIPTLDNEQDKKDLAVCEAELLESMLEFEKLLNDTPPSNENDEKSDDNNEKPIVINIDSAYNSLNRRSPIEDKFDNSFIRDDSAFKFCHECGGRYPVPSAKFCCLCGVRRLAM